MQESSSTSSHQQCESTSKIGAALWAFKGPAILRILRRDGEKHIAKAIILPISSILKVPVLPDPEEQGRHPGRAGKGSRPTVPRRTNPLERLGMTATGQHLN